MACNVPPIYLSDASANQCIFVAPGQLRTMLVHFKVNYISSAKQVGQNIFCFAGVDSIGNQGDSTCLRLNVQIAPESQNTLYINNTTHYPMGLVSKSQSTWTLIYTTGITFSRPSTKAYVRFKLTSIQQDFVT